MAGVDVTPFDVGQLPLDTVGARGPAGVELGERSIVPAESQMACAGVVVRLAALVVTDGHREHLSRLGLAEGQLDQCTLPGEVLPEQDGHPSGQVVARQELLPQLFRRLVLAEPLEADEGDLPGEGQHRRDEIGLVAITTAVVLIVAAENPAIAWQQPLLRLADTVAGVAVGIACKWTASFLFFRATGQQAH